MRRVKSHVNIHNPLADENGWVYKDVPDQPVWVTHHRPITPAQRQAGSLIGWLIFIVAMGFGIVRYLNRHMTMNDTVDAVVLGLFLMAILSHWMGGPLGRLIKYGSVILVFIYFSPIISIFTLMFVQHHMHTSPTMVAVISIGAYLIPAYFLFRWIFPRRYTDY